MSTLAEPIRLAFIHALKDCLAALDAPDESEHAALEDLKEERFLRECFVATLAHDLRGPLTAGRLAGELLLERHLPPHERNLADRVVRSIRRSEQLIVELLDVTRVRSGRRLPLELADCDLATVASDVLDELAVAHGPERFRLVVDGDVRGVWCESELRRALWNLASNAVKYGSTDRPVTVRLERVDDRVELSVHNHGAPLQPHELAVIFDPFQRARAEGRRSVGWGLGLALVKACAEAHGGSIEVSSRPESGTTFRMRLPLDARPEAARLESLASDDPAAAAAPSSAAPLSRSSR
jgi:signal transduction histidine kinase